VLSWSIKESSNEGKVLENQTELSDEQKKRREFFLYYQQNEQRSDASLIYANIRLACSAIRRFLKAIFFFPQIKFTLLQLASTTSRLLHV
jgi:hypothetical protein